MQNHPFGSVAACFIFWERNLLPLVRNCVQLCQCRTRTLRWLQHSQFRLQLPRFWNYHQLRLSKKPWKWEPKLRYKFGHRSGFDISEISQSSTWIQPYDDQRAKHPPLWLWSSNDLCDRGFQDAGVPTRVAGGFSGIMTGCKPWAASASSAWLNGFFPLLLLMPAF